MIRNRMLRWLLVGLLAYALIGCSVGPTAPSFPQCYELPPIPQTENTATQRWFDGVEPIYVGFSMGTAFAVGSDDYSFYWMTAAHVVGHTNSVQIGTRLGYVIALERNQDLAIVRTSRTQPPTRIHRFALTSVGSPAIGVGYSMFLRKPVTMIHIGHIVSKDFTGWNGNWRIVTNGGGRGGMSGGPLFDHRRGVIGVCSFFADTGINKQTNDTELAYIPGIVAGMFWKEVHNDLIAANAVNKTGDSE